MKNINIDFNPEGFSRRKFINYAMAGGVAIPLLSVMPPSNRAYGGVFQTPKDLENLTELERIHLPKISLPPVVEDGSQASIVCSCLLYTSPSPRDRQKSRMPSSA